MREAALQREAALSLAVEASALAEATGESGLTALTPA